MRWCSRACAKREGRAAATFCVHYLSARIGRLRPQEEEGLLGSNPKFAPARTKAFVFGVFVDELRSCSGTGEVEPVEASELEKVRRACHRKSGWRVNANRVV